MAYELKKRGLTAERQKPMPIMYDDIRFDEPFRSDIVVNGKVIAELKSVEALLPIHAKQVLTQLRLSGLKRGLLINFAEAI
jgi:GxxExxY protein